MPGQNQVGRGRGTIDPLAADARPGPVDPNYARLVGLFNRGPKGAMAAELATLRQQVATLQEQLDDVVARNVESQQHSRDLTTQIGALEARITQVGSEITNQLGELSGDIEGIERRTSELADSVRGLPQDLDVLRHDQEELAREQARYQIAFRQDLAQAVETLQKKRP